MRSYAMTKLPIFVGLSAMLIAGCVQNHGAAYINSNPQGAEVINLNDDTVLGVTPVKVWWRESSEQRKFINVRLQKSGFHDKTSSFWLTLRHNTKKSALNDPQFVEIELQTEGQ